MHRGPVRTEIEGRADHQKPLSSWAVILCLDESARLSDGHLWPDLDQQSDEIAGLSPARPPEIQTNQHLQCYS